MSQQMAAALSDRSVLGAYRGRDIIRTSIVIRNTGDGLSESMGIDPQVLEIGEKGYVLLEYECIDHAHPMIKDTDCLELKQVLKAGTATIVDADFAEEKIEQQAPGSSAPRTRRAARARSTPSCSSASTTTVATPTVSSRVARSARTSARPRPTSWPRSS